MNPLAIELYRRYKIDIGSEPLEFAVNNQHMNGGLAVDVWGRTSLDGCYAVGEAAGTHGVTRPGGAALNAGQVFGTRCAEHLAARAAPAPEAPKPGSIERAVAVVLEILRGDDPLDPVAIRDEVQARMSDAAGFLCTPDDVEAALAAAQRLNREIARRGVAGHGPVAVLRALQWRQLALASEAVLAALAFYIGRGGGSRGARAICEPEGACAPTARTAKLDAYRFRPERDRDRGEQIWVRREGDGFSIGVRPLRAFDRDRKLFFERNWPDCLTGAIYDEAE